MFNYAIEISATTVSEAARLCRTVGQNILDGNIRRTLSSPSSRYSFRRTGNQAKDAPHLVEFPKAPSKEHQIVADQVHKSPTFANKVVETEEHLLALVDLLRSNRDASKAPIVWEAIAASAGDLSNLVNCALTLDAPDASPKKPKTKKATTVEKMDKAPENDSPVAKIEDLISKS